MLRIEYVIPRFHSSDEMSESGMNTDEASVSNQATTATSSRMHTELEIFRDISSFCATSVLQNSKLAWKIPSSANI